MALFDTSQDIRTKLLAKYKPAPLPTDPLERSGYLLGQSLFGGGGEEAAGLEIQSATQMQDFMRQVKAEGGDLSANPAGFMQSLAKKLMDAGRTNEAMQVIEKAQTMGAQAAQTEYRMSQAEQRKMEVARDKTEASLAHLQGVSDQASLDRALAAAKRDPFTKDLDMSQIPTVWNEETAGIIEDLLRSAQTANQELNLRLSEDREARQERALASKEARAAKGEGRAIEAAARAARGEGRTTARTVRGKAGFEILSPEETEEYGFPEGSVIQRNKKTGAIVSKHKPTKPVQLTNPSEKDVKKATKTIEKLGLTDVDPETIAKRALARSKASTLTFSEAVQMEAMEQRFKPQEVTKYGSAEGVRSAFQAGDISEEEATKILRRDFGYE